MPGLTDDMKDETDASADDVEQSGKKEYSPNNRDTDSVTELVQTHRDTFVKLAESDLPVSKDAEKAIALTDGGEDQ
jgi:hypothetical protein